MTYSPPDLRVVHVDVGSAAVANTDQVVALVPAPPAGQRNRIWFVTFGANSMAHAAHGWQAAFKSFADPQTVNLTGQYPTGGAFAFPGGWYTGPATGFAVVFRCSIAGPLFYRVSVGYTVEPV